MCLWIKGPERVDWVPLASSSSAMRPSHRQLGPPVVDRPAHRRPQVVQLVLQLIEPRPAIDSGQEGSRAFGEVQEPGRVPLHGRVRLGGGLELLVCKLPDDLEHLVARLVPSVGVPAPRTRTKAARRQPRLSDRARITKPVSHVVIHRLQVAPGGGRRLVPPVRRSWSTTTTG